MRKYMYIVIIITLLISPRSFSDEPPSSSEIASILTNYWATSQFTQFENYVTNLYYSYTNYIPTKLAMSFYQYVFQGDITGAIAQVECVQQEVNSNPSNYSTNFANAISQTLQALNDDKALFLRMGSLSQITPSPSSTRNTWGDTLLPPLEALMQSPSSFVP